MIKVLIQDHTYTTWSFMQVVEPNVEYVPSVHCVVQRIREANPCPTVVASQDATTGVPASPLERKWLHDDVLDFTCPDAPVLVASPVRSAAYLSGVLVLDGNRSYGRTSNGKKMYYRCIPDDKHLPHFIIPYEPTMGFSKIHKNKYVLFSFQAWTGAHPVGQLVETLGEVDDLEAFYEYQLYSKSLHTSMKDMTQQTRELAKPAVADAHIQDILHNPAFHVQDRTQDQVFSIDPLHSLDYDDAFSIHPPCPMTGCTRVTVYLADVFVWLESLRLWNSFSNRVATIYLPDRRRPMLPTVLSDSLCSLQADKRRFAFSVTFFLDEYGTLVEEDTLLEHVVIQPYKNYAYEEPSLRDDPRYQDLLCATRILNPHTKNSHDVVTYWMIQTNQYLAQYMMRQRIGIFRVGKLPPSSGGEEGGGTAMLSEDTQRVIQGWNHTVGQYVVYDPDTDFEHTFLKAKAYMHATSPIRRLVDLLNQMMLFRHLYPASVLSPDADAFLRQWMSKMEYINTTMRSIRKVESACQLLHMCTHTTELLDTTHEGVVFDKMVKSNGMCSYMVYLEGIRTLMRLNVTSTSVENYTRHAFRLYLFENEEQTKKKVRVGFA